MLVGNSALWLKQHRLTSPTTLCWQGTTTFGSAFTSCKCMAGLGSKAGLVMCVNLERDPSTLLLDGRSKNLQKGEPEVAAIFSS